jgi:hypothetical protein
MWISLQRLSANISKFVSIDLQHHRTFTIATIASARDLFGMNACRSKHSDYHLHNISLEIAPGIYYLLNHLSSMGITQKLNPAKSRN